MPPCIPKSSGTAEAARTLTLLSPSPFLFQEHYTWDTVMPAPFAIVARPCIDNGNNQGDSPIRQMWQWSLPPGTPLCECRIHTWAGSGG